MTDPLHPRDPHQPDPGGQARVLMRLHDLRRGLEDALGGEWLAEPSQFLKEQIEKEVAEVSVLLDAIGSSQKKGRLARWKDALSRRRREHPDFEGNAWTIPIPELVGFLSYGRKTGVLWVDSESERFVIELRDGGLVRATSDRTPVALRLGELLVELGSLEGEEIEELVRDAKQAGMSLGGYLIRSGRVREDEIEAALLVQVQGLFHRLMSTENAVYRFREGVDLGDARALDLNVTTLLLEGARRHDEGSLWRECDGPELAGLVDSSAEDDRGEAEEPDAEPQEAA